MSDFMTVVNAILGSVQHLYNMASQNAPYLLYILYAGVSAFVLYLIIRFVMRL